MAKKKEEKTNVMRILDQRKIPYTARFYEDSRGPEGTREYGVHVAEALGQDPARGFKTLVARGASKGIYVFEVPAPENLDLKKAARAVGELLSSGAALPTAFLCANEEGAVGALLALREAGLSVPGDLSVVSFNDTPRSALVDPPLTSVSTHVEEMARAALRLLGERASIGGREPIRTLPLKLVVPPTLTVRESTGPVRRL